MPPYFGCGLLHIDENELEWLLDLAEQGSRLAEENERLRAELDPPVCRLQFPDGSVPGNAREAAEGWHARYESLKAEHHEAHAMLTGNYETGWCMTHPDNIPDTELGKAAMEKNERIAALESQLAQRTRERDRALNAAVELAKKTTAAQQRLAEVEAERDELRALFVACSHTKDGSVPMTLSEAEVECEETLRRIRDLKTGKSVSYEEAMAAIGKARQQEQTK